MESTISNKPPISILLADDEFATVAILANVLAKKYPNFPIYTAENGKTAFELFKSNQPNIVITDVNMPEMNGVQMAAIIRSIDPSTKFIFLTGNSGKDHLRDHDGEGFEVEHYIVKPVRFGLLFAAIEQSISEIERKVIGSV